MWRQGLLYLLISLVTGPCWALSIRGHVRVKGDVHYLQLGENSPLYEIKPLTQEGSRNLERLVDNDTLQGQGEFSGNSFLLQTLDFVGLSHLLGVWHSTHDQSLVTFEDFQTVSILNARDRGPSHTLVLDYSIAPDRGDLWRIFVSGRTRVSIANMQLSSTKMILQFINLETGALEPPLELTRESP